MVLVVLALFPGPSGSMAPPSGVPGSKIYDFLRSRVTPSGVPGSKIYDFMRSRVPLRSRVSPSGVPGPKIYDFIKSRVVVLVVLVVWALPQRGARLQSL